MKKNLQDIDKLFRDGLEDHLERAPEGVWDAVNNDLDKKQALLFRQKYFRLKRVALVLLLLIFSGITYVFYYTKQHNKNTGIAQNKTSTADPVHDPNSSGDAATTGEKKTAIAHNTPASESAKTMEIEAPAAINSKGSPAATVKQPANAAKEYSPASVKGKSLAVSNAVPASGKEAAAKNAGLHTAFDNNNKIIPPAAASSKKYLAADNEQGAIQNGQPDEQGLAAAGKRFMDNSHHQPGLALGNGQQTSLTNGKSGKGNPKQIHYKLPATNDDLQNALAGAHTSRQVTALSPYLYQAPLLLALFEPSAPGPFVAMGKAPFLNNVIENDSLKKAIAASKIKKSSNHPISVMAFGSPNHSFTRLENDDQLAGPGRNKYAAERDERQGASYSAGLLVNYGISKTLILQSGLVFSSAKTNISPKVIYARPDNSGHTRYEFNCASGYSYISPKTGVQPAVGDSIQVMGSSSTITYIGVPLSLNYVWQRGRLSLKPGIGLSVNFLTGGNSSTLFGNNMNNQKDISSISGLKKAYLDGSVGLGAEWMLNRTLSIGIRPLLRMALTAINKDTPVKTYQNYLSFETGLKINL